VLRLSQSRDIAAATEMGLWSARGQLGGLALGIHRARIRLHPEVDTFVIIPVAQEAKFRK
jgi:hypothetical protein